MTREEARKAAEVMLAYADGEKIEFRVKGGRNWGETSKENTLFDWNGVEYRVKPKPKFDPKALQPFDKVLARGTNEQSWACDLFSHIKPRGNCCPYVCVSSGFNMVIPYNEDTKHLVGTSDEAPEFYRYWED